MQRDPRKRLNSRLVNILGADTAPSRNAWSIVAIVIFMWAASGALLYGMNDRGTFGDMFGAINALFSGLAFAGVIYAILLQRIELRLQRNELSLTRQELAGQREQLQAQNETLKRQNFESTFFQLLRLHNDIVNAMDLMEKGTSQVTARGRDCFRSFYRTLRGQWVNTQHEYSGGVEELERINGVYLRFYGSMESELGHYFRSLYNIVKFVDNSPVKNKRLYTNLVRAQLSSYEVALLFYNSLSELGRDKFRPLIERYALLKMVPRSELFDSERHISLYKATAFTGSASE
jgi:hypothetical protein